MKRPTFQGRLVSQLRVFPKPYPAPPDDPAQIADAELAAAERQHWEAWPFDLEIEVEGEGGMYCLYGDEAKAELRRMLQL